MSVSFAYGTILAITEPKTKMEGPLSSVTPRINCKLDSVCQSSVDDILTCKIL